MGRARSSTRRNPRAPPSRPRPASPAAIPPAPTPTRQARHRHPGVVPRAPAAGGDITELAGRDELLQLRQVDIRQGPADVYAVAFAAGAGYGDPIERDPEAVRRDVEVGDISLEAARDIFRVALVGAEPAVDHVATAALRHRAIVERLGREPRPP